MNVSSFSFHREKEEKKIENPQPAKLTGHKGIKGAEREN